MTESTPKKPSIETNVEATKNEYRLRSPFHSNKNYHKKDLKTTNEISYKQPIEQCVIDAKYRKSEQNTKDALKHLSHLPPKYEVSGLPKPTHSNDACKVYHVLSPKSKQTIQKDNFNYDEPLEIPLLPTAKQKPWIGSNRFSSRNQLGLPHSSYDLNNDGAISPKEYAIAKFFDKDNDGKLNKQERENALKAIKNGIQKQYLFSSKGVHKLTKDEIKSLNGGWMKHDGIINRDKTRSKLLRKRKKQQSIDADNIAQKYFENKEKTKIAVEFPYEFATDKITNKQHKKQSKQKLNMIKSRPQTADICPLRNKTNRDKSRKNQCKTRSELFENRRDELMDGLEKSRAEAEEYFQPVAYRKLDHQQEFLRKRSKHKSTKTLKDLANERHEENYKVGRYWESRTNFEIFNAKKLEKEFWQNAYIYKENDERPINRISNEMYNMVKNTYKSVDKLPLPFQCPKDDLKHREKQFLSNQRKENDEIRIKQQTKPKYEPRNHENFREFSDKLDDVPDNLCVLYGGRKMSKDEEGVSSWFKQRKSSLSDTSPMYSSFSRDGIFREPTYSKTLKSKSKTNLFQTTTIDTNNTFYRPRTAPIHNQSYSTLQSSYNYTINNNKNNNMQKSMFYHYQSTAKFNQKNKLKFPIRTSGFGSIDSSMQQRVY